MAMVVRLANVNDGFYKVEIKREIGTGKELREFSKAGLEEYLEFAQLYCETKGYEFIYDDNILQIGETMKIQEITDGVPFYLSVESGYFDIKDAKGEKDAVAFQMGQYPNGKHEIDSVVSASVEDARAFALSIIKLCDEIED